LRLSALACHLSLKRGYFFSRKGAKLPLYFFISFFAGLAPWRAISPSNEAIFFSQWRKGAKLPLYFYILLCRLSALACYLFFFSMVHAKFYSPLRE